MKILMMLAASLVIFLTIAFVFIMSQDLDMREDPTYESAVSFLDTDKTDEQTYVEDIYDCHNFAVDVRYNASLSNIRCAYVMLVFEEASLGSNHAIVAFDTTDRGVVFFEPQNDDIVYCNIGDNYRIAGKTHTITDIQYFWEVI